MAYEIAPVTVREFVSDKTIRLPRFQRKSTWDLKQNFSLCVSMFKGYPLGVVIYNTTKNRLGQTVSYLLDGRQRRTALKKALENPIDLYVSACKALNLKPKDSVQDVDSKFWKNVSRILTDLAKKGEDNDDNEIPEEDEANDNSDIDSKQQLGNLQLLLQMILMVHGAKKKQNTPWQIRWDFHKFFQFIPYVSQSNPDEVMPVALKDFILELSERLPADTTKITANDIKNAVMSKYPHDAKGEVGFTNYLTPTIVGQLVDDIKVIRQVDLDVFSQAKIGVIRINNVTALDSQNIFSLINSGGTKLKAEELLSAKPFWNTTIPQTDIDVATKNHIQNMYDVLKIPGENDGHPGIYVYWDVCATFINRIDQAGLIVSHNNVKDESKLMKNIIHSFKLISACIVGGIGIPSTEELEKHTNIAKEVEGLVADVNAMSAELMKSPFYQSFHAWGKSIIDLIGLSPTCAFLATLWKSWQVEKNNPKQFVSKSYVLFDRLIYEYTKGLWRGSSDSKLRQDLKDLKSRFATVDPAEWKALIDSACDQRCKDYKMFAPLLRYFLLLQKKTPNPSCDTRYDTDHIIPQNLIEGAADGVVDKALMNSLGNLAIFPRLQNESKYQKRLNELGAALKHEVAKYTDIDEGDFEKYSNLSNLSALIAQRKQLYMAALGERSTLFGS